MWAALFSLQEEYIPLSNNRAICQCHNTLLFLGARVPYVTAADIYVVLYNIPKLELAPSKDRRHFGSALTFRIYLEKSLDTIP